MNLCPKIGLPKFGRPAAPGDSILFEALPKDEGWTWFWAGSERWARARCLTFQNFWIFLAHPSFRDVYSIQSNAHTFSPTIHQSDFEWSSVELIFSTERVAGIYGAPHWKWGPHFRPISIFSRYSACAGLQGSLAGSQDFYGSHAGRMADRRETSTS